MKCCEKDDDNNKFKVDIYNIKSQSIETSIKILSEKLFYNEANNLLLIILEKALYILNPKDFSITQEILTNHKIKVKSKHSSENENKWSRWDDLLKISEPAPEPGHFIFSKILSQNSFITIFEGDFRCLGKEYINLIYSNTNKIKIINLEYNYYNDNNYKEFSYLIVYKKNNNVFEPKKIIYLVKNEIRTDEVAYVTGKHCDFGEDEGEDYCLFNFDGIFQISENKFILKYQSKIELRYST